MPRCSCASTIARGSSSSAAISYGHRWRSIGCARSTTDASASRLLRPWADRTTHVTMTTHAFIARLASLVPRPRKNTIVYFGVLAAHALGRTGIVPCPEPERRTRPDASWAALMKHSFGLDVLKCPRCDGWLQLVAVLHDREEVRRLLEHLYLWSELKPLHPARGPPDPHQTFDFPCSALRAHVPRGRGPSNRPPRDRRAPSP